jgi:hypothetical protein
MICYQQRDDGLWVYLRPSESPRRRINGSDGDVVVGRITPEATRDIASAIVMIDLIRERLGLPLAPEAQR